jgi:hypothetical protein
MPLTFQIEDESHARQATEFDDEIQWWQTSR